MQPIRAAAIDERWCKSDYDFLSIPKTGINWLLLDCSRVPVDRVSVGSVRLPEGSLVAYSGAIGSNTPPQLATRGLTMPGVAGQGSGSRLACACCRVRMVLGCHMIFGVE